MAFKVLIADQLAKEGLAVFAAAGGLEVVDKAGIKRADLIAMLPEFQALVVRSATEVDAEVIAAGKSLQVIGRAGIGVDNVDVRAATRAGVVVMNTPEGNATTTAEHTLAMMMAAARMIPAAHASMRAGKWEKKQFLGRELFAKTLGVIGLGNIGRIVVDRAQGLRMKVLVFDPYLDAQAAAALGVEAVPLDDLLRASDVITVHTPLNDETRGLVGAPQIDLMKKGVILVNCARGGIYDEAALLAGLNSGQIGAAALDVFAVEPPPPGDPLVAHPRVVCTPHLGASTQEAQVQVSIAIAEQILAFARGEAPRNTVNLPRISPAELRVIGPFIDLAERMGSFGAQLLRGSVRRIEVDVRGEIAAKPTTPLVAAAVAGALRHAFDRPVNAVNARILAEERGVKVVESRSERAEAIYANVVRVSVEGQESHRVAGTLFEGGEGRFVEVDGWHVEAVPDGWILVVENRDEPGVVGHIGTVLGNASINIARMQLGLDRVKRRALSLVNIDHEAPPEVLRALNTGAVTGVRQVQL